MLVVSLFAGFAAAAVAPWLARLPRRCVGPVAALVPLSLFLVFASYVPAVADGATLYVARDWIPTLGVTLAFRLDGLSLIFALLITGIGAFVFAFAGAYLADHPLQGRFFAVLFAFMAAMLGTVLADNLIVMFVFWEVTGLASFLLIGFEGRERRARDAALQALLITAGGGLALLAGLLLLGAVAASFELSRILAGGSGVLSHPLAPAIIVLVLVGAFTKSAQFPFHFWLPNAMEAPTPVSAYLHSATMVKLGVFLLARLNPVFGQHEIWTFGLTIIGALTMLTGAVLALRETDLKRVLAQSTVLALGTLVMLIGMEHGTAAVAAMTFLVVHALYKAAMFLVAGIIDHETGTRDATRLGGLRRAMPFTAAAALLASLSMAGLPPFVGFVGKELLYEANLGFQAAPVLLTAIGVCANAAMVMVAGIVAVRPFLGELRPTPRLPHEAPLAMLAGPAVFAVLGLLFGLAPTLLGNLLVAPAAAAVLGRSTDVHLTLWHGFTPVFWLSVTTLGLGTLLFLRWDRVRIAARGLRALDESGPEAAYASSLFGMQRLAALQTRALQHGRLRVYMATTLTVTAALVGITLVMKGGVAWPALGARPAMHTVAVPVLLIAGALMATLARGLLAGIVAVGLVGYGSALLFLLYGAPDLAFTQFAVETLFIVLLTAVLLHLPFREPEHRVRRERQADMVLATVIGAIGGLLLLAVLAAPFDPALPTYFGATSVPEAHGRNVVNVIIVDFRALDTLGEIAVLGFAGLAVFALLRRFTEADR